MKKYFKNIKWILFALFIVGNIISYNHAYRFTHFTAKNGKRIKPENLSFGQKIKILFLGIDNPKPVNDLFPSIPYEIVNIQSHEKLEGWLIEKENPAGVVILFHGYSGSKSGNVLYAATFNQLGYTTLSMDFMGSGGSTGIQTTVGYKESRDVKEAFEFIKGKYPEQEIILFGPSMGAVSIMKSIADYDIQPDKIIIECPFGSMKKTVQKRFEAMHVPSFPFAELLLFYGGLQNGFNAFKHHPTDYAKEIKIPTLLLYGLKDKRVTPEEIETIYNNLQGEKKQILLKDSGHENYLMNSREIWINGIQEFLLH